MSDPLPPRARRRPLLRAALLAAGAAVALSLVGRAPRDQTVRIVLGPVAPVVRELRIRYAAAPEGRLSTRKSVNGDEWLREATFRFQPGSAPKVVIHHPELPDGNYHVEIDVLGAEIPATIIRHGTFSGAAVTFDLTEASRP